MIAERVRRALATPRDQWPLPETSIALDEQGAALVELLSAVVRVRAAEEFLPPSLLATADDLRQLVNNRGNGDTGTEELFLGWRGELVGSQLKAVLSGETAVSWDARRRRMRFLRVQPVATESPKPDAS
jgi:ribonuclease D